MEIKLVTSLYATPFDTRRQPELVRGDVHHVIGFLMCSCSKDCTVCACAKFCARVCELVGCGLCVELAGNLARKLLDRRRRDCKMNSLEEKMKVVEGYCEVVVAAQREKLPEIERLKRQMDSFEEDRGMEGAMVTINNTSPDRSCRHTSSVQRL